MYWPIGAPKAYAVSKVVSSQTKLGKTQDGLEDGGESSPSTGEAGTRSRVDSDPVETEHIAKTVSDETGQNGRPQGLNEEDLPAEGVVLAAKVSRGGSIFATITRSTLTIWQARPIVALASVVRSSKSMKAHGPNSALILRPDALIVVVQTTEGYFITYSLATDPNARVYAVQLPPTSNRHTRKDSVDVYNYRKPSPTLADAGPGEGEGIKEVNIQFRMVIRIDAGISKALALDDELVVATQKPAALQCIRWASDHSRAQTTTELLSKMSWVADKCTVIEMIHDRPMNLTCWITSDGRAYAVQTPLCCQRRHG